MTERPVTFSSAGQRLCGMLGAAPQPQGRRGAILLHGWAGYRIGPHRMLVHMGRRLLDGGFHTLRLDLRGRGDSEGDGPAVCLDDMIDDTVAAMEFLSAETGVNRITLVGICSGANVAIGAATLRPEASELVLWSVLPFQRDQRMTQRLRRARFYLREYSRKALQFDTWRRLLRGEIHARSVARTVAGEPGAVRGGKNLKDSARDIMAALGEFRGRALFVTGTMDPEGMAGHNLFLRFCRRKGIAADFRLVEGATHSFYAAEHEREVTDMTMAWLQR